jgi:hypothetical protein
MDPEKDPLFRRNVRYIVHYSKIEPYHTPSILALCTIYRTLEIVGISHVSYFTNCNPIKPKPRRERRSREKREKGGVVL